MAQKGISNEPQVSAEFGEALVAYLLAREGVEVIRGPTKGFDLFARDRQGRIFQSKDKLIGISVKTRLLKEKFEYSSTVPIDSKKVSEAREIWNVEAWLALVVGRLGYSLRVFLLPYTKYSNFRGRAKREDVVSVSALEKDKTGTVRILLREASSHLKTGSGFMGE